MSQIILCYCFEVRCIVSWPILLFLDNSIVFPLGLSRIPRVIGELFEKEKKQEKRKLDLYINVFFQ